MCSEKMTLDSHIQVLLLFFSARDQQLSMFVDVTILQAVQNIAVVVIEFGELLCRFKKPLNLCIFSDFFLL